MSILTKSSLATPLFCLHIPWSDSEHLGLVASQSYREHGQLGPCWKVIRKETGNPDFHLKSQVLNIGYMS
jgi:hypothetical protein